MIVPLSVLAYLAVGLLLSRRWTRQKLASTCPGAIDRLPTGFPRPKDQLRTWLEYYQDPRVYKDARDVYFEGLATAVLWPVVLFFRLAQWSLSGLFFAPAEKERKILQEQQERRQAVLDHWAALSVSEDEWVRDQAVAVRKILDAHQIEAQPSPLVFTGTPEDTREAARQLKEAIDTQRKAGPHYGAGGVW